MGEVYRADDLKLGHPVALKFLPKDLADDPRRLQLFHDEVRLARQVSHPNVCRVHDIGEVDGQHFLSMEYIDGEDLRGLLRRIGRLPKDKGIEIAQQLCMGLAAAHEKGVLHRDLKPANIMLDGRGQVRITDYGLARSAQRREPGGGGRGDTGLHGARTARPRRHEHPERPVFAGAGPLRGVHGPEGVRIRLARRADAGSRGVVRHAPLGARPTTWTPPWSG